MAIFRLSVITDEITQDLGRALEVAAGEFGLEYVELREMWGKNIMNLDSKEIAEARRLLEKYKLRVSSIGSPVFKVDWPDAPGQSSARNAINSAPLLRTNSKANCSIVRSSWPEYSTST